VNPAARLFLAACAAFVLVAAALDLWLYLRRGPAATISSGIRGATAAAKCGIVLAATALFVGLYVHLFLWQY
jgi:hypothetical protein